MRMWKVCKSNGEAEAFKKQTIQNGGRVCMRYRNMRQFEKDCWLEPHTLDDYNVVLVYTYDK